MCDESIKSLETWAREKLGEYYMVQESRPDGCPYFTMIKNTSTVVMAVATDSSANELRIAFSVVLPNKPAMHLVKSADEAEAILLSIAAHL